MSRRKPKKPTVAIYDLTDCEGCEVKLISLRERLLALERRVDIVNWRLGQERVAPGPYDITIIEGSPITAHEVETLKTLRAQSKTLIALGACATIGGIPAIMPAAERARWYKRIYGAQYKPRGIDALPLVAYVSVDVAIHGCPVDEDEVVRVVEELLAGKAPRARGNAVCFDCKRAGNPCRLLEGKPCLGPITQGGCKAICVSGGSPCYGCFGLRDDANIAALRMLLLSITTPDEVRRYFSMFHSRTKGMRDDGTNV